MKEELKEEPKLELSEELKRKEALELLDDEKRDDVEERTELDELPRHFALHTGRESAQDGPCRQVFTPPIVTQQYGMLLELLEPLREDDEPITHEA